MRLNELNSAKADSIIAKFKEFINKNKDIPRENPPTLPKDELPERFSQEKFQDRLSYIDKRYEHLRKLTNSLKKKITELEDIMRLDNDDENIEMITQLLDEIKKEKQKMRDEAHIIRGELSQAMYNEDLRSKILNFINQFESLWYEEPEKHVSSEYRHEQEDRLARLDGTSHGDDEVYTPSSSEGNPYRETSF